MNVGVKGVDTFLKVLRKVETVDGGRIGPETSGTVKRMRGAGAR